MNDAHRYDAGYENYIDGLHRDIERLMGERDELDEENVALRKLVSSLYSTFVGVVFDNWSYTTDDFKAFEQRMEELGVIVNWFGDDHNDFVEEAANGQQ